MGSGDVPSGTGAATWPTDDVLNGPSGAQERMLRRSSRVKTIQSHCPAFQSSISAPVMQATTTKPRKLKLPRLRLPKPKAVLKNAIELDEILPNELESVCEPAHKRRKLAASRGRKQADSSVKKSNASLIVTLRYTGRSITVQSQHKKGSTFRAERDRRISTTQLNKKHHAKAALDAGVRLVSDPCNAKPSSTVKGKRNAPAKSKAEAKATIQPEYVDNRGPSWGTPLVWAETRAELADSLPYFNSYQGSAATKSGVAKGMLLDDDCGERSHMDEEIVVTRSGGGVALDEFTGVQKQMKDQDGSHARIISFLNNMSKDIPVQLIVGSKNVHCPSKIPFRYCVMGGFRVTYVWSEKTNGYVVFKYRMEKIDLTCKSWWAAETSGFSPNTRRKVNVEALHRQCHLCLGTWKQVYKGGWMCLNGKCALHWKLDGADPTDTDLEFHENFLLERADLSDIQAPYATVPKLSRVDGGLRQERTLSVKAQCWKGIVCEICGRCNQRRDWDAWRCYAPGCPYEYAPRREIIPASAVMGDVLYPFDGHAVSDDKWDTIVACKVKTHGFYMIHDYLLPHDSIKITHTHSNGPINAKAGGADDIFRGLQEADLGLKRLSMKQGRVSGLLAAHFSKNYGLPYDYIVGHPESTSFENSPAEIREAIRRSMWAGKRAIEDESELFLNECLAVGYFEGGSMGYHDDGEDSLGPHVVAWSLGCPASMKFRMKYKYFSGLSKTGKIYHPEFPVLPGCYLPEERLKLNEMAKTMAADELNAKAQKILKGCPKNPPVIIEMKLRHGDFMSMHGASMQVYYEHEVVSNNELRFGLTCRYVKPEMVDEDQRSKGDLFLDPANAYDGDLQVFEDWKKENESMKKRASMQRKDAGPVAAIA